MCNEFRERLASTELATLEDGGNTIGLTFVWVEVALWLRFHPTWSEADGVPKLSSVHTRRWRLRDRSHALRTAAQPDLLTRAIPGHLR